MLVFYRSTGLVADILCFVVANALVAQSLVCLLSKPESFAVLSSILTSGNRGARFSECKFGQQNYHDRTKRLDKEVTMECATGVCIAREDYSLCGERKKLRLCPVIPALYQGRQP